jgi:predicted amidohydrolase YtcJ
VSSILVRRAEVNGEVTDVRIRGGTISEIRTGLAAGDAREVIDAEGGALIPGLHDHHVHLLATAAADESISAGPPQVHNAEQLAASLRAAAAQLPPGSWLRAVGYYESVSGDLDRAALDAMVPDHCARVQHRSGSLWVLNTRALQALGIASTTGRLYRSDEMLRERLGDTPAPALAPLGARLASYGVTGVTDATPSSQPSWVRLLDRAVADGALPQSVVVMGGLALAEAPRTESVRWGPVKFVITDHFLPPFDEVCDAIATAHRRDRAIAIHCVTEVALALALAAWLAVDVMEGDRIEHAAVVSPDAAARIGELGLTVVTQPGFIATRGDDYLRDVASDDVSYLYPCASLQQNGVRVGGSTDAPYGDADPWKAIQAAIERRTESGAVLGANERVAPRRALDLFLTQAADPGGAPRSVVLGEPADLCLLDGPLERVLESPSSHHVRATIISGRVVFRQ